MNSASPILRVIEGISANSILLWYLFAIFFALYSIFSIILIFHWVRYGMGNRTILFAQGLYIIVSLVLFAGGGVSLLAL